MNGPEFVQSAFRQLRREYEADLTGLTQEQLAWSPGDGANLQDSARLVVQDASGNVKQKQTVR